jgi:hypothetical protein
VAPEPAVASEEVVAATAAPPVPAAVPGAVAPAAGRLDRAALLALQRGAGNRAVGRLLQRVATYTPGPKHDHTPSGKWAEVQKAPNSGFFENRVCANSSPQGVVDVAVWAKFDDKPIAKKHLDWYLSTGKGADFVEDANLESMLRTDSGVQAKIIGRLPSPWPTTGTFADSFRIEQGDYSSQDFRFAFGGIDRFDIEVDWSAKTLHAWFQDRYEWHPVYPGLYTKFPDDAARETNCVHAALVELQSSGAADYWMKGEATVPLLALASSSAPAKKKSWWETL